MTGKVSARKDKDKDKEADKDMEKTNTNEKCFKDVTFLIAWVSRTANMASAIIW